MRNFAAGLGVAATTGLEVGTIILMRNLEIRPKAYSHKIHAQLNTRSKAFCSCSAAESEEPNMHTCPVCLGHFGTLPVLNAALHRAVGRTCDGLQLAHSSYIP